LGNLLFDVMCDVLCFSTNIMNMKWVLHLWNGTCIIWKETCICEKRPAFVKIELWTDLRPFWIWSDGIFFLGGTPCLYFECLALREFEKRDLHVVKETYTYEKRPTTMKRHLHLCKETYIYEMRPASMKWEPHLWNERSHNTQRNCSGCVKSHVSFKSFKSHVSRIKPFKSHVPFTWLCQVAPLFQVVQVARLFQVVQVALIFHMIMSSRTYLPSRSNRTCFSLARVLRKTSRTLSFIRTCLK